MSLQRGLELLPSFIALLLSVSDRRMGYRGIGAGISDHESRFSIQRHEGSTVNNNAMPLDLLL